MNANQDSELAAILSTVAKGRMEHSRDAQLDSIAFFADLARVAGDLQTQAARSAHASGASWSTIGNLLGISRQGAQQRFDPHYAATPPTEAHQRLLGPVERDEELQHLSAAGREGWRLVAARHGEHVLEQTAGNWEVIRVSVFSARGTPKKTEGWEVAATRFPDWFFVRASKS